MDMTDEQNAIVAKPPVARLEGLSVRRATPGSEEDLTFIDALQKMHSHMVGFLPRKAIEKHIEEGIGLIAEERAQSGEGAIPVGYAIARDQYLKRDDVGIIYQLNVMPIRHRQLVGATLVKGVFEQAAYGCRLFSAWCAQDIQANWFWESLGFVPLAFRTGSRAKQRIHIFWQRRVRDGDDRTDYWFPSQTMGGSVAEDRIVLPIPPGTHWRDAKPLVLPGLPERQADVGELPEALPGGQPVRRRPERPKLTNKQRAALARSSSAHLGGAPIGQKAVIRGGKIKYVPIPGFDPAEDLPEELAQPAKPKKPRKRKQKNDPKYVAAARELRDRYLEEVNSPGSGNLLPPAARGNYDVSRALESAPSVIKPDGTNRLLDAA